MCCRAADGLTSTSLIQLVRSLDLKTAASVRRKKPQGVLSILCGDVGRRPIKRAVSKLSLLMYRYEPRLKYMSSPSMRKMSSAAGFATTNKDERFAVQFTTVTLASSSSV